MKTKLSTTHFIMMGGTIDSFFDPIRDKVVSLKRSMIPGYLHGLQVGGVTFTELCMKDSRDLTPKDFEQLLHTIKRSVHAKLIVTHGTYTMPDTARYLEAHLRGTDKTVVLTASMIPITGFAPSDGPFNLGFAFAEVQRLRPGVHVCMQGQTFKPTEVAKIISQGRFISIFGENNRQIVQRRK